MPILPRNVNIVGRKLRQLREEMGKTQGQVAENVWGDQSRYPFISGIESGARPATEKTLRRLLIEGLDVRASEADQMIAEWKAEELAARYHVPSGISHIIEPTDKQLVPLLGSVSAAKREWKADEVEGWLPYPFLSNPRGRIFALKVEGDCMAPGLKPGDMVFVDTRFDDSALNGKTVVCRIDKEETTLKRLYRRGDMIELRPDNPAYPSIHLMPKDDFEIIGVVIKTLSDYR